MTAGLGPSHVVAERQPESPHPAAPAPPVERAAPVGLRRTYRPCLLTWLAGEPTRALIDTMRRTALYRDRRTRLVPLDEATQVLLLAEDSNDRPSRERVGAMVRSVVDSVRAVRPEVRIHAVVGDRVAPGARLALATARLHRLARRGFTESGSELVWGRRYSLASLLEALEPRQAGAFVEEQLASVRAYDCEHGTNLERVLELALDHPNRNTAASAAFMHRNTFRRQLEKALELAGVDLDDPEERLALHVALKLQRRGSGPALR